MQALDEYPELQQNTGILDNKYKIIDTIGEGRYAKVKLAIDITNDKKVAIKIMKNSKENLTKVQMENFISEVKILASITHVNIIKLYNVSINGEYKKPDGRQIKVMYYVMKIAEYRELFNIIEETSNFPENIARYFFRQIIEGIEAMHSRQIGHRDIKPENILIDKNYKIKICDFGFACKSTDSQHNRIAFESSQTVGSPEYNPPEISNFQIHYNSQYFADEMDLFAAGLVLFLMVMKSPPFQTSIKHDPYYQRLCRKDKTAFWKIFSQACKPTEHFKDLIEKMLSENPENRLTLEEIKNHQWYLGKIATNQEIEKDMKSRTEKIIQLSKKKFEQKKKKNLEKSQKEKINTQQANYYQYNEFVSKYKQEIQEINENIENMRNRRKAIKKNDNLQQQQKQKYHQKTQDQQLIQQNQNLQNQSQQDSPTAAKKKSEQEKLQNSSAQAYPYNENTQVQTVQQQQNNQQQVLNEENLKRQQEQYKKYEKKTLNQKQQQYYQKSSSGSEASWEGKQQKKKTKQIIKKQSYQSMKKNSGQNTGSFSSSSSHQNQEELEGDKKEEKKNQDSYGQLGDRKDQL